MYIVIIYCNMLFICLLQTTRKEIQSKGENSESCDVFLLTLWGEHKFLIST